MSFQGPDRLCNQCPRLFRFLENHRMAHPYWHNAPVPSFGRLNSRLLIVGLAPGLKGMMESLGIDLDKLQYFEQYDPIKEQMAGLTRGQSELEAKRGFGQALSGAQAQVGQSLGQAYAQGRAGGGGFGGDGGGDGEAGPHVASSSLKMVVGVRLSI